MKAATMSKTEIENFRPSLLTWPRAKELITTGVGRYPKAIEEPDGRWLLSLDLGDPDDLESLLEDLLIRTSSNHEEPKAWASLDALRSDLRQIGYVGSLRAHFLSV